MQIPSIHVGCGRFSLQRLEILIGGNQFKPVACVDLNLKKAKMSLSALKNNVAKDLIDKTYTTITEAKKKHDAKVCFIYVSSKEHAKLIVESINLGMHTFCVKSIASNQKEFKSILKAHKANPNLMLVQGFNNQWNESAAKMREWIQSESGIGKMLGGECICWGRQNLISTPPQDDVTTEGMFFHALACHQLSQLVAAKGIPDFVTAYVHNRKEIKLDYRGIWGTSGGQCLFEYPDEVPFSYVGTRAAHGNPFGFASRWSGQWTIHGEKGDIRREGGHLTLYKDGGPVEDLHLKDLDANLIKDEEIQFSTFYESLIKGKNKKWLQESSLDTWILMESCNESARKKEKISIKDFKKNLLK